MGNKKRLFEVMSYLNPESKLIENYDVSDLSGDVLNIKNVKSDALKNAYSNIDNQKEFNDAFMVWFNSLGFNNENNKKNINITSSIAHIRDYMEKKGIKY